MTDDSTLKQGVAALKAGRKVDARRLISAYVQDNPNDGVAWMWLYHASGDYQQRLVCLKNAKRLIPNDPRIDEEIDKLLAEPAPTGDTDLASNVLARYDPKKTRTPGADDQRRADAQFYKAKERADSDRRLAALQAAEDAYFEAITEHNREGFERQRQIFMVVGVVFSVIVALGLVAVVLWFGWQQIVGGL